MTIDKAIESLKLDYEIDMYIRDIAPQIANWLEELKIYKECNISKTNFSMGYNKAIDDFVKECEAEYDNDGCPNVADYLDYKISIRDLCKIAEQLKNNVIIKENIEEDIEEDIELD